MLHSGTMISHFEQGGIVTLSIARPEARNALPIAAWEALAASLAGIDPETRVLILRSEVEGIFSAGADLTEFASLQLDPPLRTRFRHAMRAAIEALASLPMPTIAAVDGGCFGAAVALVLACDLRIAGAGARFATTPAKLGIGYPREDVARLTAQVGRGQAARMLFTGATLDAAEAERIGLVELTANRADEAAARLAEQVAANAPRAVRMLKRTLVSPADPAHDAAFDAAFGCEEFTAGLAAFNARPRA